jgi:hypothetical protein
MMTNPHLLRASRDWVGLLCVGFLLACLVLA